MELSRNWKSQIVISKIQMRAGVSASGVSATLPSASCVGLKISGRADLCRDSAKQVNLMALAAPSVDVCPHRAECPVLDSLRKQPEGD